METISMFRCSACIEIFTNTKSPYESVACSHKICHQCLIQMKDKFDCPESTCEVKNLKSTDFRQNVDLLSKLEQYLINDDHPKCAQHNLKENYIYIDPLSITNRFMCDECLRLKNPAFDFKFVFQVENFLRVLKPDFSEFLNLWETFKRLIHSRKFTIAKLAQVDYFFQVKMQELKSIDYTSFQLKHSEFNLIFDKPFIHIKNRLLEQAKSLLEDMLAFLLKNKNERLFSKINEFSNLINIRIEVFSGKICHVGEIVNDFQKGPCVKINCCFCADGKDSETYPIKQLNNCLQQKLKRIKTDNPKNENKLFGIKVNASSSTFTLCPISDDKKRSSGGKSISNLDFGELEYSLGIKEIMRDITKIKRKLEIEISKGKKREDDIFSHIEDLRKVIKSIKQGQNVIVKRENEPITLEILETTEEIKNSDIYLSKILREDDFFFISKFFKKPQKYILIYNSMRDGCLPSDFHRCCDNRGRTIVFIKSGGYVSGGYTDRNWKQKKEYPDNSKKSPSSFLFSLNQKKIYPIKEDQVHNAIFCNRDYGPIFGNGHDLVIDEDMKSDHNYSEPYTYNFSDCLKPKKELFGYSQFVVDEYEVYEVEEINNVIG